MKKVSILFAASLMLMSCTVDSLADMKPKKEKHQKIESVTPSVSFTYLTNEIQSGALIGDSAKVDYNFTSFDSATARDILRYAGGGNYINTGRRLYGIYITLTNPASAMDKYYVQLFITTSGRLTPGTYLASYSEVAGVSNMRTWLGDTHWTSYTPFKIVVSDYNSDNELTATFSGEKVVNGEIKKVKIIEQ